MKNNKHVLPVAALAAFLMAAPLGACTTAPPMSAVQPDLTFAQYQNIPLAVSRIDVFEEYKAGANSNSVEHEFETPPGVAAHNLAKTKLVAAGAGNGKILRVFIDDASVQRQNLPVRTDLVGTFTRQPAEKYAARVTMRFELVDETAPDIVLGRANIGSDRTTSILENTSLADRDQAYLNLTEALMRDVYDGFRTTVQRTFGTPR